MAWRGKTVRDEASMDRSERFDERSHFDDTGSMKMDSTDRFDERLISKLKYPVPGIRATMIDHSVERLPMTSDSTDNESVSRKPERQVLWNGDAGGDFYRPLRTNMTQGPTNYDISIENAPSINEVERHFANYLASGEQSRFPKWTRSHWTADAAGPSAFSAAAQNAGAKAAGKQKGAGGTGGGGGGSLRHRAFREINAATVMPGPYWGGEKSANGTSPLRPQTGGVLESHDIRALSITKQQRQPPSARAELPGGAAQASAATAQASSARALSARRRLTARGSARETARGGGDYSARGSARGTVHGSARGGGGGPGGLFQGPQATSRSVGENEAYSWQRESGSWKERGW